MTEPKNQKNTPLLDCLKSYARGKNTRMHMPCHQGRLGFLPNAEQLDLTELGFNDNLDRPTGVIKEAQFLFARLFGAKEAIFLTNGSSQGIFAFLSLAKGKTLLLEKDAHISAKRGAKLFGVNLLEEESVSCETIEKYAKRVEIFAVLVRFPDYFGNICDLKALRQKAKERGILLLVDCAHGAHFGLCEHLPDHPVAFCDACVVSTHKTLGAFTQTAVVLTNDEKIAKAIKAGVNLTSSTSPSYLLMASIDFARSYCAQKGKKKLDNLYENLQKFCKKLPNGIFRRESADFCKLCLNFGRLGINGKTAFEFLAKRGIFAELYKGDCVLFYLGIFTRKSDLDKLLCALKLLTKQNFEEIRQEGDEGPFEYGEEL